MREYIVHAPTDNALAVEEYTTFYGEPIKELIRCKDCKWASVCYRDIVRVSKGGGAVYIPLGTDGYCSRAERREE